MSRISLAACLLALSGIAAAAGDWRAVPVGGRGEILRLSGFPAPLLQAFSALGGIDAGPVVCGPGSTDPYAVFYRPRPDFHLVEIVCQHLHERASLLLRHARGRFVPVPLPIGDPRRGFTLKAHAFSNIYIDAATGAIAMGANRFCDSCDPGTEEDEAFDYQIVTYELNHRKEYVATGARTYMYSGRLRRIEWQLETAP